ncbi:DUF397 domain-containing protein [Nocardiopsis sp. EMB25]|uniref:DUF397 domain-containing protein n=1 Tax=Nocardiopsis sp. EMB25 TaxID=2835867 RepID=UPI00228339D1|nr:DUF397 domain-containing protein [Nocardiopsis sp. EMB25]MCY9787124.1 DUF397 domain-containing protein [Nocardiopsis sp. EMB25]
MIHNRPGAIAEGWRKASYSGGERACVEVGEIGVDRAIRDTQNRALGALAFDRSEWTMLLAAVTR